MGFVSISIIHGVTSANRQRRIIFWFIPPLNTLSESKIIIEHQKLYIMYNIFAMKNGVRELVKGNVTMLAMCNFIDKHQREYIRRGYNYLIGLPV